MGNSNPPKYLSSDDAKMAIGYETWARVKSQLEKYRGKSIDFEGFEKLLRSRFERMVCEDCSIIFLLLIVTWQPKILVECLYQAFAYNMHNKIELNDFLAGLSIVSSQERVPFLKFLFRVYDVRQLGRLDRRDVEKLLTFAYGDRFRTAGSSISRHLDALFNLPNMLGEGGREKQRFDVHGNQKPLGVKEFQQFDGRLDVLGKFFHAIFF